MHRMSSTSTKWSTCSTSWCAAHGAPWPRCSTPGEAMAPLLAPGSWRHVARHAALAHEGFLCTTTRSEIKMVGAVLYHLTSTGVGLPTLGEEYCNMMQVNGAYPPHKRSTGALTAWTATSHPHRACAALARLSTQAPAGGCRARRAAWRWWCCGAWAPTWRRPPAAAWTDSTSCSSAWSRSRRQEESCLPPRPPAAQRLLQALPALQRPQATARRATRQSW